MKSILIATTCLLSANLLCAQHKNLDKLPQKQRDSILVEIANEAIDRYSIGYLRPGEKPYIEDIGFKLNEKYKLMHRDAYIDRYHYAVYYLPTEMEKKAYGREYRVRALILADIGKVTEIRYCDDYSWRACLENDDPDEPVKKRRLKPAEERLKEIERFHEQLRRTTQLIIDSSRMSPEYRKFVEMKKRKQDSFRQSRQRYLIRQDSIRREDSIRRIQEKI